MPVDDRLLTVKEVSEMLGMSEGWVYAHATKSQPRLPSIKLGGALRFRESKIVAFIDALEREALT